MEIKGNFLHKFSSKRSFIHRIQSFIRRTDNRGSLNVSDICRQFTGQAYLLRSESRSRIEYLIPTNNIILLDSYFNLTSKIISLTDFNTVW